MEDQVLVGEREGAEGGEEELLFGLEVGYEKEAARTGDGEQGGARRGVGGRGAQRGEGGDEAGQESFVQFVLLVHALEGGVEKGRASAEAGQDALLLVLDVERERFDEVALDAHAGVDDLGRRCVGSLRDRNSEIAEGANARVALEEHVGEIAADALFSTDGVEHGQLVSGTRA